jgi:hypothetical protein
MVEAIASSGSYRLRRLMKLSHQVDFVNDLEDNRRYTFRVTSGCEPRGDVSDRIRLGTGQQT